MITNKFDSDFSAVLKELENLNQTFAIPDTSPGYEEVWTPDNVVRMWSVPRQTGELLYEIVEKNKPKVIVEMGTSSGYSTIFMAAAAAVYGGHVYTIEVAEPKIALAQSYFDRLGLSDTITIVPGLVSDVLQTWSTGIDMVFMDADKMNYLAYLKSIEPFLNENSLVTADNVLDYGHLMKDFLDYVDESDKYKNEIINIDNGVLLAQLV